MFTVAGQQPDSWQASVDQMEIAALLTALQISVGLALLGRGLTAPHVLSIRAGLIAASMVVIFLRIELVAA